MNAEIYKVISTVGFILAAIMLILSIILFLKLNIPKVIGDITGKTAKKAIQRIHEQNEQSGDKAYKSSPMNIARGKISDKITNSGNLIAKDNRPIVVNVGKEKISTQELKDQNQTTVLCSDSDETTVLDITESLDGKANVNNHNQEINQQANLEQDITFIHTDEVIL